MPLVTRRTFASFLSALIQGQTFAWAGGGSVVRIGAIRWDAWYGVDPPQGSSETVARHNLDPEAFHDRAPFFAKKRGDKLEIAGVREDLDAEIKFAVEAGINYWLFGWYGPDRALHKGWAFYQDSPHRDIINWCILIGTNSLALKFPQHQSLICYFKQDNYERVGNRPLLFILHEATNLELAATMLTDMRRSCVLEGCGDPYVVVMSGNPSLSASEAHAIGADAISSYVTPLFKVARYSDLARATEEGWRRQAETGMPVIPTAMTGWDRRPRKTCAGSPNNMRSDLCIQDDGYVARGSKLEISDHIMKLVDFIRDNRKSCVSHHGLIYSWNENDEGGTTIMPTLGVTGGDALDAVGEVLRRRD